jgi:hypothetical protein
MPQCASFAMARCGIKFAALTEARLGPRARNLEQADAGRKMGQQGCPNLMQIYEPGKKV